MEYLAIFVAAVAASRSAMQIFFIAVAGSLVLYVALVAAVIRELHMWGRDMEKRAALWEREHQEYMISLKIAARRRREEHARPMKGLNARRR